MLNQILAKLVAKYPGLSKAFLGLLAKQMATKVTEESGIDAAIAELDNAPITVQDLAAEFQREGDRRVTDAKKEWEKKNPPKPLDPPKPDDPIKDDPEMPAWAKTLIKSNENLQKDITALTKDKAQSTIQTKLTEKLKDKKIPSSYYAKRALPEKEEDLDAFATEIETDYTAFKQELVNEGLVTGTPAGGGEQSLTKSSGKEEAEIKAWAESNKKPAATK